MFEAIARRRINLEKSKLIQLGELHNTEELARILEHKVGTLLPTSLGQHLGGTHKSNNVGEGMQERF